jgi:CRP-like cAMP-binding protein
VFILAQGQVEVYVKDQNKKEQFIKDLNPGTLFGEVAILNNTRRTASIRCKD